MTRMQMQGGEAMARELGAMSTRVSRSVLREALVAGGEAIRRVAASNAPRAPGAPDLADNIRMSPARPESGDVAIAIGPTTGFFYGYFQEFGTSRHRSQPFMRPAFDSEQRRTTQIIGGALWQAIIRKGGGSTRGSGGGGGLR